MILIVANSTTPRRRPTRPAFTFIEVAVSAAMVAVLLALIGQLLVLVKRHSQATERHAIAMQTVENSLEEFTALPWNEIDVAHLAELKLPESIIKRWPNAKLSGEVAASTDPTPAKRITLKLTLNPELNAPPARLATWVFQTPSAAE
jgi:type II secretory pathway pseudopilin PulG